MIVAGAGLAGLIAANMLRNEVSSIFETQSSIPNNHTALLRFKTSVVGDAVNIPLRKVRVMKAVDSWRNPVADALSYSIKCTGTVNLRSSTTAAGEIEDRYIAPNDFMPRLMIGAGMTKFCFDTSAFSVRKGDEPIISTIPMPSLMEILGYEFEKTKFEFVKGYTVTYDIPKQHRVNVCATVYLPDPEVSPYRASITDSRLIIEVADGDSTISYEECRSVSSQALRVILPALKALGIHGHISAQEVIDGSEINRMKYAKILPIDDEQRKRFIMWASTEHGVYSLGRFATWRPKLLLDDIVNDVRVISRMASGDLSSVYAARRSK